MSTTIRGALRATVRLAALALATTLVACGGDSGDDTPVAYDNHLALQVGDRRVYRQTLTWSPVGTTTSFSTETVTGTRQVGGLQYHLVESTGENATGVALYAASASAITVRDPDDTSASLDLVRFPAHEGGSFVQDLGPFTDTDDDEDGQPDRYTSRFTTSIEGVETLSTPAGTFTDALHVRDHIVTTTTLSATGTVQVVSGTRDTWYVPGVGRVRQDMQGSDFSTREELMAHVPAGRPRQDTTAPVLLGAGPAQGTALHAGAPLVLTFDEPVTDSVLSAITVTGSLGDTPDLYRVGPVDPTGRSVRLSPLLGWNEGTYTVRVAAGIEDFAGNRMAARPAITFPVSGEFALVHALPYRQADNVTWWNMPLTAYVNKPIDPASLATVTLRANGTAVAATVATDADRLSLSITPAAALQPSTRYTIELGGLRSNFGFSLANPQEWAFTTSASTVVGPTITSTRLQAPAQWRAR